MEGTADHGRYPRDLDDDDVDHHHDQVVGSSNAVTATTNLQGRKVSWAKLRRVDSLNLEASALDFVPSHNSKADWKTTLLLAFQSIGVIYGDIGTSPLYVYSSTFTDGIHNMDDILGVLSLIIYTILLSPFLKYVFIVLNANDNGNGGTFALYSLICRNVKVSLLPNQEPEDRELSNYNLDIPSSQLRRAQKIKEKLEGSAIPKVILLILPILGTSMVIGDGILTPSISVLSAVGGISSLSQDAIVGLSVAILLVMFCAQRFGTDKVGYSFAPIISVWFLFIGGIGVYNLVKHDLGVLRAFNPLYIVDYFKRNGKNGYVSLGGVVLCITGTEAMFADLGHFNIRAVQISFTGVVLPALLATYCGQAAYLRKHPDRVSDTFYACIPGPLYWPQFVVAVAAAIIASQAMISGAFAIISQALRLGCFPRVKVVRTSVKYDGQVYIPELNYFIMSACIAVTLIFRTTEKIGHAYGIAVVSVMCITTCLVTLIMLVIWKVSIWLIALFFLVLISVEGMYLSAVLSKFVQGGYLPITFSLVLMTIMGIWHYVNKERYTFELNNKVSSSYMTDLTSNSNINRIPGIGLLYSELVQGIPPIFPHFINNIPSIHSVLVFVSIKSIPLSSVTMEERFLFRQVEPREYRIFRCVVRYGYADKIEEPKEFERQLVERLKYFINQEHYILESAGIDPSSGEQPAALPMTTEGEAGAGNDAISSRRSTSPTIHVEEELDAPQKSSSRVSSGCIRSVRGTPHLSSRMISRPIQNAEEEMEFVDKALEHGVVYLLGEVEVVAKQSSSFFKKAVVDSVYSFLRKNFRKEDQVLKIPRSRILRVGMTYEI